VVNTAAVIVGTALILAFTFLLVPEPEPSLAKRTLEQSIHDLNAITQQEGLVDLNARLTAQPTAWAFKPNLFGFVTAILVAAAAARAGRASATKPVASSTDRLTGLSSLVALNRTLPSILERVHRTGTVVSVAYLDVDSSIRYNDRYGHQAGDVALRHLAALLVKHLPSSAFIARVGGEKFVVCLEEHTPDQLRVLLERVQAEWPKPPTLSVVITQAQPDDLPRTLIERSVQQMSTVKQAHYSRGNPWFW
jgi:diguanylate cyclase (GGDEF)-like protein